MGSGKSYITKDDQIVLLRQTVAAFSMCADLGVMPPEFSTPGFVISCTSGRKAEVHNMCQKFVEEATDLCNTAEAKKRQEKETEQEEFTWNYKGNDPTEEVVI